jgi:hypothetical protein
MAASISALIDDVDGCACVFLDVNQGFPLLILLGMQLSFLDHLLDVSLRHPTR